MVNSILVGLVALSIGILCEKPKLDPYAGKTNLIKVDGVSCGTFEAIQAEGDNLQLTGVMFRKDQIPLIWSGGFVVKPAQRIGMTIEVGGGDTYRNVWVEYMDPYSEQQDSITIARMELFVENQEERPEQEGKEQGLLSTKINIMVKDQKVGTITSLDIKQGKPNKNGDVFGYPTFTAHRVSFSRERVAEAFNAGFIGAPAQKIPLQIEVKQGAETIMQLHNCWVDTHQIMEDAVSPLLIAKFSGQCEEVDYNSWKK